MTTPPSIPRRALQAFLVALFAALLFFPLFQHAAGRPADKRLGGIANRIREFPHLSARTWLDGSFARTFDAWVGEYIGVRGWLVCLARQIRYSLFGQVEAAPLRKRALVIGKPPFLYENILLIDALRPPQIAPERMEAFAARLARMQELLRRQGMAFLVVLAPNKALVYSDALPAWAREHISDTHSDYLAFRDALRRRDVPFLDSMALFREQLPEHPNLIPPHAIHWGHEGAWLAWQHAIPLINNQGILPELPVPATEALVMDKPSSMNDELRGQLNLFFSPFDDAIPSAYPVAAPLPAGTEPALDALIVGDSFGFTFLDAMARSRLCRTIHFWFYLQTFKAARPAAFDSREIRGIAADGLGVLRPTDENGIRALAGKNLVLLVVTTFNIDKYAWGFDRLVARLYGDPDEKQTPFEEVEVNLGD